MRKFFLSSGFWTAARIQGLWKKAVKVSRVRGKILVLRVVGLTVA